MLLFAISNAPSQETGIPEVSARQLGYSIRLWTLEDGLPLDRIHSLAQTTDGYLWIGADSGKLSRFDGTRFTRIPTRDNPLAYTQIYERLLADADGGLWMRSRWFPLGRYFDGRFEEIPGADLLSGDESSGPMIQAPDGSLWIAGGNRGRFFHFSEGHLEVVIGDASDPSRHAVELASDISGDVWGVWSDGALFRLTGEGPEDYVWQGGGPRAAEKCGGLMRTKAGNLAVFSPSGMHQLTEGRWVRTQEWPTTIPPIKFAVESADGTVWLAPRSSGQVYCLRNGELSSVALPDIKPPVYFHGILADDVGNVWIATLQGLIQIRPVPFRTWSVAEGLLEPRIYSVVAGADSRVWFKTSAPNVHYRFAPSSGNGRLEQAPFRSDARFVAPVDEDSGWLVSRSAVWFWNHDHVRLVSDNLAGEGDPPYIQTILLTKRGELWIATLQGVFRWDGESFVLVEFPDGPSTRYSNRLAEDSDGRVFVSTYYKAYAFENGVGRLLSGGDDVPEIGTMDVAPDGSLWVISSGSRLARWSDGEWRLLDSSVTGDIEGIINLRHDDHGGLWLGTESQGVIWFNRQDLNAVAEGRHQVVEILEFGPDDGLGSLACDGFATGIANGPDGRVWIATADGISVIDPGELEDRRQRAHLPTAVVEGLLVDDRQLEVEHKSSSFTHEAVPVPPGSGRLEIRFAAIDLASGNRVRFQYRLKNHADEWEQAGTARSAIFHRVPPGNYVFELQAANAYGVWNPEIASLAVSVLPFWWQRSSVQSGFVLLAFAGMWWVYRERVRSLKRRQAMQESFSRELINSQERERKRIAGELHDSLGQELLVIKSRIDLGTAEPRELSDAVRNAIGQVKQISKALRPAMLERAGLSRSLSAMVKQVSDATGIPVEVDVENVDAFLSDEAAMSIYRLVQESLNNIVAHSDASEASVTVRKLFDTVMMEIVDDGRGFDYQRVHDGSMSGSGVRAMVERVSLLHGSFQCDTAPGSGTRIRITIPRSRS